MYPYKRRNKPPSRADLIAAGVSLVLGLVGIAVIFGISIYMIVKLIVMLVRGG
jgi:hypothetical protein